MEKLKPCPFCGHTAKLYIGGNGYWVECSNSKECGTEQRTVRTKKEALEKWNRRSDSK